MHTPVPGDHGLVALCFDMPRAAGQVPSEE